MENIASLHPFFVHFPIALFLAYSLIEVWGILSSKENFGKTALVLLVLIVVASVLSALTGNQAHAVAESAAKLSHDAHEMIEQHETFATISIWYFIILLAFRIYLTVKKKLSGKIKYVLILLALIGCVLILTTGKFGGNLVYDYGIGTELFKQLN